MKFVLNKTEVEKILDVMKKFPQGVESYRFDYTTSGIGHTLDIFIPVTVEDIPGELKVNITGVENW